MDYSVMYGFLVALGVGALNGIEREKSHKKRGNTAEFIYARLLGTKEFGKWIGGAVGAIILARLASLYFV